MTAAELLNSMVPYLKPTDSVGTALDIMEDFHKDHLPVVADGKFMGMANAHTLEQLDLDALLEQSELDSELASVDEEAHFFEVVKTINENQAGIVVVIDADRNFLGVICNEDIVESLGHTLSIQSEGTIVILELYMRDLAISEISRILEAENIKLLGLITRVHEEDPAKIYLTIKLNSRDSSRAIAVLERFEYTIIGQYNINNDNDVDRERLDNLMRFLNV